MIYCGTATFSSVAADYPERPVRVIVASSQGSAADVSTRIIAGVAKEILNFNSRLQ
jgi:tripartite-type tricarboxylate transporter receptor subunit TctC